MERRSGREWATAVLLPLVWVAGVVLLWRSRAWTTLDKLIGTLVVPGGLAYVIYVAVDAALLFTEGVSPKGSARLGSPSTWGRPPCSEH